MILKYISQYIYLYGKETVGKDVELAFEKHADILQLVGGKFLEHTWDGSATMHYKWEKFTIDVNVSGSSNCTRVKVGSKSRTINEDVYDIVCK